MHCGCSLPGDSIGDRLSRLTDRLHLSPSSSSSLSSVTPLAEPAHPSSIVASHASEHPSLCSTFDETLSREKELKKRWERDAKNAAKGKMDKAVFERGVGHVNAFVDTQRSKGYVLPRPAAALSPNNGKGKATSNVRSGNGGTGSTYEYDSTSYAYLNSNAPATSASEPEHHHHHYGTSGCGDSSNDIGNGNGGSSACGGGGSSCGGGGGGGGGGGCGGGGGD